MKLLIAGIALVASAAQSCGQATVTALTSTHQVSGVVDGKGSDSLTCKQILQRPGSGFCQSRWWIEVRDSQGNKHYVAVPQRVYDACRVDVFRPDRYPQCVSAAGGAR